MEPNEEAVFKLKSALDGGVRANILLTEQPSTIFHLLSVYLHEIPGSIFTAELLPILTLLLPPPGIIIDASRTDKFRQELSKLPAPNVESLKWLAWYFMQLETEASYPPGAFGYFFEVDLLTTISTLQTKFVKSP
jgi:hypothetical protein